MFELATQIFYAVNICLLQRTSSTFVFQWFCTAEIHESLEKYTFPMNEASLHKLSCIIKEAIP